MLTRRATLGAIAAAATTVGSSRARNTVACDQEWFGSKDQVMRMVPTTLEGARAMARLALMHVDKDTNYRPIIDNDPQLKPLIAVAAWLAEDTALLQDIAAGLEVATPVALPGWGGMTPAACFAARGEAV